MADKKFSDLVANADTNLAVAAIGDYLLIYDISEPLDINKIKVISIADFQDSILPPIVTARQGGSATDLNIPGTTNYSNPAGLVMIFGVAYFAVGNDSVRVTYPFTWADKPFVIAGLGYQYGSGGYSAGAPFTNNYLSGTTPSQTTTYFDINIGASNRTCIWAVPWIAIGVPA